jgi:hypothetical protein
MTHFLLKIVENPQIEDPPKNAPSVHKHFIRYSSGLFDGPVVKISQTKGNLSIGSSFEYEDELFLIASEIFPEPTATVSGKLISGEDFSSLVKEANLSSEFLPSKSKGKAENFNCEVKGVEVPKETLQKMAETFPNLAYTLVSFAASDKSVSLSTKKTPPRPNSKNPEDSGNENRLKFCTLKLPNTPENLERVIKGLADDIRDEIPSKWKSITINNSYEIKELILPQVKDSRMMRVLGLRKGILNRVAEIDGKEITKKYEFTA